MRTNAAKEARKLRRRLARYPAWEHLPKRNQRAMRKRARRWHKQQSHAALRKLHQVGFLESWGHDLPYFRWLHSAARRAIDRGLGRPVKAHRSGGGALPA